jgi:hypothetical protein
MCLALAIGSRCSAKDPLWLTLLVTSAAKFKTLGMTEPARESACLRVKRRWTILVMNIGFYQG